jgi:hypothetical protein
MTNLTLTTMPEIDFADNRVRRGKTALEWIRVKAENNQYGSEGGTVYMATLGDHSYTKNKMYRGETAVCLFKTTKAEHGHAGWAMTVRHPVHTDGMWLPVYDGFNEHEQTHYVKAYRNAPAGAGREGRTSLCGFSSTLRYLKEQATFLAYYEAVFPVRMSAEVWN